MMLNRTIAFALLANLLCASLFAFDVGAQRRRRSAGSAALANAAARTRSGSAVAGFNELVAAYRRDHAAFHATENLHSSALTFTGELDSRSSFALNTERRRLRATLARLERTRTWLLPARLQTELKLVGAHARAQLIELDERAVWECEPSRYVELIAAGADATLRHPSAAPDEKLQLFLRRAGGTKKLLDEARANLANPPRVFTLDGIVNANLAARFFRESTPQLFERAAGGAGMNAARRAEFARANAEIATELNSFSTWLSGTLLPRSTGRIAVGADVLRRMLQSVEMIDTPLDELERRGAAELRQVQDRMSLVAEDVAPGRGVAGALDVLRRERPSSGGLVGEARLELDRLAVFLRANDLFPLPARLSLAVAETPVYLRARRLTWVEIAAADAASATQMRFYVTAPESGLDARAQDEHLAYFNRYALPFVSIGGALPGALPLLPVRAGQHTIANASVIPASINTGSVSPTSAADYFDSSRIVTEGWSHYCERALLTAGFGGNNPKYELAQLNRRRLDACRYLVALAMHRERMNFDEAIRFFEREASLSPTLAARFAREVALDPLALSAVLGGRELDALRADAQRMFGSDFRLREFHDAVLAARKLPMPLLRARVLEGLRVGKVGDGELTQQGVERGRNASILKDTTEASAELGEVKREEFTGQNLKVDFTVLAIGTMSEWGGGRAIQLISDPAEFAGVWRSLGGAANMPGVNFATRSVILVRQGERPTGGHSIAVTGITQAPDGLVVRVTEQAPAPGMLSTQVITSPYVLVSIARFPANTPVRFADNKPGSRGAGDAVMGDERIGDGATTTGDAALTDARRKVAAPRKSRAARVKRRRVIRH
jgi:hypothetical protein